VPLFGVGVGVGVGVPVVGVGVGVGVAESVGVGVGVGVAESVGVGVGVGVAESVGVGVGVGVGGGGSCAPEALRLIPFGRLVLEVLALNVPLVIEFTWLLPPVTMLPAVPVVFL
jgi:hypothetical protein